MTPDKSRRHESEIARHNESIELLGRALYLLPALAATVALATPVGDLRLPGQDLEAMTLLGMIGELPELRSAGGVRPIVLVTFASVLVILAAGVLVAWPKEQRILGRMRSVRPAATTLTTAGIALVLLALPLALVLDSADHAANDSGNVPFLVRLGGIGMLALTGVVAVTVAQVHRSICD